MHDNWRIALPMLLTDLIYWQTEEGKKTYSISAKLLEQIKYRLRNIIANVGQDEVKELAAHDGFSLDDDWFKELLSCSWCKEEPASEDKSLNGCCCKTCSDAQDLAEKDYHGNYN